MSQLTARGQTFSSVKVLEGAFVWLVFPRDEGVFHGVQEVDGVRCVHPVQVYVDLKGHPERADEAAEHLLREHLGWGADADRAGSPRTTKT